MTKTIKIPDENSLVTLRIKNLMKKKKVTQRELADMIGMTQAGLSHMFAKHDYKSSVLILIAKALNVSPAYFYDDFQDEIKTYPVNNLGANTQVNEMEALYENLKKEKDKANQQYLLMLNTINYLVNYIKEVYGIDIHKENINF